MLQQEGTAVSVAGVHQEVSKQTHAINKSEVYSHYLGLLFRRILALAAQGRGWGGAKTQQRRVKQGCRKKQWEV